MANKAGNTRGLSGNRRFTRFSAQAADWGEVDADIIRGAIAAASMAYGALRFGYTSDGGAYALGIYGDGDKPYTEYIRPSEDIEGVLRNVEATFLDIHVEQSKGTGKAPK